MWDESWPVGRVCGMGAHGKALWGAPGLEHHLASIFRGWLGVGVVGNDHPMVFVT